MSDETPEEKGVLEQFDDWLKDGGAAALVIREPLEPIDGPNGVFFPSTFAAAEDKSKFAGGYNIDSFSDGTNVCLVDSVGSQANRIEPIFGKPTYAGLVPRIEIKAGDKTIDLLEAGHRAGDALVRCSELQGELQSAFKDVLKGNAEPLARIAPTSLVFGAWDSRDTQAKLPRLVSSTIRAFNVYSHTRSANFLSQQRFDYVKEGVLPEPASKAEKDEYSKRGYLNALATAGPGGVQLMTTGSIRRDATLSLAALRRLNAVDDAATETLRRYILGLALVALTAEQETYLRQGCDLVPANDGKSRAFEVVYASGNRAPVFTKRADADAFGKVNPESPAPVVLNPAIITQFALLAAKHFGIDPGRDRTKKELPDREVSFSSDLAKKDIKGDAEKLKGEVVSLEVSEKKFKLKFGKKNDQKEVEVGTNESTTFFKGKEASNFDAVVVQGAKLDVVVTNGVAVKVTG